MTATTVRAVLCSEQSPLGNSGEITVDVGSDILLWVNLLDGTGERVRPSDEAVSWYLNDRLVCVGRRFMGFVADPGAAGSYRAEVATDTDRLRTQVLHVTLSRGSMPTRGVTARTPSNGLVPAQAVVLDPVAAPLPGTAARAAMLGTGFVIAVLAVIGFAAMLRGTFGGGTAASGALVDARWVPALVTVILLAVGALLAVAGSWAALRQRAGLPLHRQLAVIGAGCLVLLAAAWLSSGLSGALGTGAGEVLPASQDLVGTSSAAGQPATARTAGTPAGLSPTAASIAPTTAPTTARTSGSTTAPTGVAGSSGRATGAVPQGQAAVAVLPARTAKNHTVPAR